MNPLGPPSHAPYGYPQGHQMPPHGHPQYPGYYPNVNAPYAVNIPPYPLHGHPPHVAHPHASQPYPGHTHPQSVPIQYPQQYQYPPQGPQAPLIPQTQYVVPPSWIPNMAETAYLENWFRSIDVRNSGVIQGADAVSFLKRSNLSRDILRKIWGLVDVQNVGSIDRRQFAIMMRLVSLACAQPHIPISMERYHQTTAEAIPLPSMTSSDPLPPTPTGGYPQLPLQPHPFPQTTPQPPQPQQMPLSFPTPETHIQQLPTFPAQSNIVIPAAIPQEKPVTSIDLDDFDMGDFQSAAQIQPSSLPTQPAPPQPSSSTFHHLQQPTEPSPLTPLSSLKEHSSPTKGHSKIEDLIAMVAVDPLSIHAPSLRNIQESQPEPDLIILSDPLTENIKNDHGPNLAMSAFDEIIEQDLNVTEDWNDFESSAQAPEAAVNPFDMFLQAAHQPLPETQPTEKSAPSFPPPSVQSVPELQTTNETDEDFGNFESGIQEIAPSHLSDSTNIDHFGDFEGTSSEWSPPSHTVESLDNIPVPQEKLEIPEVHDDFGDFIEAESPQHVSQTHENNDFEETNFGDFTSFESSVPNPPENQPIVTEKTFEDFPVDTQTVDSSDALSPNHVTIEEEEFDDFESAPPVETSQDPFAELGDTKDSFLEFVPPLNQNSAPSTTQNHLDILSEFILPSTSSTANSDDFIGFSSFNSSTQSTQNSLSFLDDFVPPLQHYPSSSGTTTLNSMSLLDNTLLDLSDPVTVTKSKQLPKPVDRNLTSDELEHLSSVLFDLNLYFEAYCCIRQSIVVKNIKELNTQKMNAVNNDNLELAIKLRDEINTERDKLLGTRDDEMMWLEIATAGKKRESIEDIIEFLESIDPICGEVAKTKFLILSPDEKTVNLHDRLLFYMNSRRCLQLAIAVRTTHKNHMVHWKNIITVITSKLTESLTYLEELKKLKKQDQEALISHKKMVNYLQAIFRICDVGKWISASCQDAMIETAMATKIISLCDSVMNLINSTPLKNIQNSSPSLAELANIATDLIGRKDVAYCSLTLRPIRNEISKEKYAPSISKIDHQDFPYMQAALSLWLNSFPGVPPPKNPIIFN